LISKIQVTHELRSRELVSEREMGTIENGNDQERHPQIAWNVDPMLLGHIDKSKKNRR
jgi:hypothetical protein